MAAPNDGLALAGLDHEGKNYHEADEKIHESSSDVQEDDVHAGLEFPTDEERATLRRVADALPWTAYRTSPGFSPSIPSH
jgi:POT family proton-dependent oligopeptide transporter